MDMSDGGARRDFCNTALLRVRAGETVRDSICVYFSVVTALHGNHRPFLVDDCSHPR